MPYRWNESNLWFDTLTHVANPIENPKKLTPPKTNSSNLKMGAPWKMRFLLETIIFGVYLTVVFGCVLLKILSLNLRGQNGEAHKGANTTWQM